MGQKRILVVEDSKVIAQSLCQKFMAKGFIPILCTTLAQTKELLSYDKDFLCATLDLSLPDATDGEIVDLVLSHQISSIILSATYENSVYETMINKNVIDFVVKNREEDLDYVVKTIEKISYYSSQKVLVVDDSALARGLAVANLKNLHFNILEASDGKEALEVLEKNPDITLVLTDYNMPRMDGFELVLELRKRYTKEHLVIIAISSQGSYEVTSKFLKYGANSYIVKPFTKEEFNYTINNAMEIYHITRQNKKLLDILDTNVMYSTTDLQGNITFFSQAFERVSGYKQHEVVGKKHNIFKHPEIDSLYYKSLWETITRGEKWSGSIRNRRKDGSDYWVKGEIEPIKNGTDIEGYASIHYDISDKVQKEAQQNIMLQQSRFATMGQTISDLAHHWRQPLTVLAMVIQNIQDEMEFNQKTIHDSDIVKLFSRTEQVIQELSRTIDNFRKFFTQSEKESTIVIHELMQEVLSLSSQMFPSDRSNIQLSIDENLTIVNFENELKQLFLNLITNAKEAIERQNMMQQRDDGEIKISAYQTHSQTFFTISDNGGGIDTAIIDKIFDPYFSTKKELQGKGLGLYFAKILVENSISGQLLVENGKYGAIFHLIVPHRS